MNTSDASRKQNLDGVETEVITEPLISDEHLATAHTSDLFIAEPSTVDVTETADLESPAELTVASGSKARIIHNAKGEPEIQFAPEYSELQYILGDGLPDLISKITCNTSRIPCAELLAKAYGNVVWLYEDTPDEVAAVRRQLVSYGSDSEEDLDFYISAGRLAADVYGGVNKDFGGELGLGLNKVLRTFKYGGTCEGPHSHHWQFYTEEAKNESTKIELWRAKREGNEAVLEKRDLSYARTAKISEVDLFAVVEQNYFYDELVFDLDLDCVVINGKRLSPTELKNIHLHLSEQTGLKFPAVHTQDVIKEIAQRKCFQRSSDEQYSTDINVVDAETMIIESDDPMLKAQQQLATDSSDVAEELELALKDRNCTTLEELKSFGGACDLADTTEIKAAMHTLGWLYETARKVKSKGKVLYNGRVYIRIGGSFNSKELVPFYSK